MRWVAFVKVDPFVKTLKGAGIRYKILLSVWCGMANGMVAAVAVLVAVGAVGNRSLVVHGIHSQAPHRRDLQFLLK
jgi:hypothetical protein